MRVAVVGHVEYVEFLDVDHVPRPGEIIAATSRLQCAAGGGAVAAVALARWAGGCDFYTALGDDELGHRAHAELTARGVNVHAAWRTGAQRRAVTMVDAQRERTITVIGDRHVAHGDDPLPWGELVHTEGVYITGGDIAAVRAARQAKAVISTARILPLLQDAAIAIDALVSSAADLAERYDAGQLAPDPRVVVRTEGG
jgi:ribokinase